nr:intercellular adhesion molecule 2 isoform X2 [Macaca fascicularis]
MSSFGFGTLTVALFALVCCSGSDEKAFEVHMRLEKLIVKPKESFEVNCSTTCNQPEVGGLETSLNKILLLEQTQWKHYLISNISHDTVLWCHFTCSGKQKSMSSNVSVYHAWSPEINMSVKLPCSPASILNRRPLPLCTGAGQATASPTMSLQGRSSSHCSPLGWPWASPSPSSAGCPPWSPWTASPSACSVAVRLCTVRPSGRQPLPCRRPQPHSAAWLTERTATTTSPAWLCWT